jgi:hypothetical protein
MSTAPSSSLVHHFVLGSTCEHRKDPHRFIVRYMESPDTYKRFEATVPDGETLEDKFFMIHLAAQRAFLSIEYASPEAAVKLLQDPSSGCDFAAVIKSLPQPSRQDVLSNFAAIARNVLTDKRKEVEIKRRAEELKITAAVAGKYIVT